MQRRKIDDDVEGKGRRMRRKKEGSNRKCKTKRTMHAWKL